VNMPRCCATTYRFAFSPHSFKNQNNAPFWVLTHIRILWFVALQGICRLCVTIKPHKKSLRKYILYLIVDYIGWMVPPQLHCLFPASLSHAEFYPPPPPPSSQGQIGLPPTLKQELLPGIFSLLDMCTKFELQHVHTLLDSTGKALFKALHQGHTQGKFDGRV
jgi:hypothetical protein